MKNTAKILSLLLLFCILASLLTSCLWMSPGNLSGGASSEEYVTKEEVQDLLEGIEENITVNGGDNYNVEINNQPISRRKYARSL